MLTRIKAALTWSKILRHYRNKNYIEAEKYCEIYKSIGTDNSVFKALYATINILNKNSQSALKKFDSIISSIEPIDEDRKYVLNYSLYYVALINKNKDADNFRTAALQSDAKNILKQWLPLSPHPVEISLS